MRLQVSVHLMRRVASACHCPYHERGSVLGIAADKDVLGIVRMLRFEESHCKEACLALYHLRVASLNHDGTASLGIRLPIDGLHADATQLTVLAYKLQRIDVPAARTSLFVAGRGLEHARIVRPRILRIGRTLHGARHNLNLRDTLTSLSMRRSDAVRTCVATADDQNVLALAGDTLILRVMKRVR